MEYYEHSKFGINWADDKEQGHKQIYGDQHVTTTCQKDMEYYEHSKFGIDLALYQTMFAGECKSDTKNRMTEIVMIQSLMEKALKLLDRGIKIQKPIILNPHWRGLVEEEKWKGNWDLYRDHYRQRFAHRIEHLYFIDVKYHALLLFATSRRVTDQFKKELEEDRCICRYDEHNQNAWIQSDCNEVIVEGNIVDDNEDDEVKAHDEEDDNEEHEEIDAKDENLKATEAMTVGKVYTKLKGVLEYHFKNKNLDVSLLLSLKAETEKKCRIRCAEQCVSDAPNTDMDVETVEKYLIFMALDLWALGITGFENGEINRMMAVETARKEKFSNGELFALLEKLTKVVVESENEEKDVAKVGKFNVLLIINSMATVIPGDKGTKSRIDWMFNMERCRCSYSTRSWSKYSKRRETKGQFINRFMEINMVQELLKHGLEKKLPVSLSDFWKKKIIEEKWNGDWTVYKQHFNSSLAKKIEHLHFIERKFRALIMFVANMRVSVEFRQKLIEDNCECEYDEHSRIVSIISDDNEIRVSGNHRKVAEKEYVSSEKEDSEEDSEDEIKTIGNLYDRLKHILDSYFKCNQMDYVMYLGLKEEAKHKEVSNHDMMTLLEKLSKVVVESEDEEMDVAKVGKFNVLLIINSMATVVKEDRGTKSRIDWMFNMECHRQQKMLMLLFDQKLVEILEEIYELIEL
ncbi:hypothetical protein CRE_14701 [Caenorhabditis remanei]|uniref:SPK domain-containing protein n=1 Tax=Caenorhabditis remanei TaxID=31234 RepID=E3M9N1_CAERE|nr:hypothetical protein CRE_14701 [Caenorhabditis remanei]